MTDWRPIEGHDLKIGERALFKLAGDDGEDIGDFEWVSGRYVDEGYILTDDCSDFDAPEWDARYDMWRITHYARINGPDAPNPVGDGGEDAAAGDGVDSGDD